jgi:hypothetical protein
MDLSDAHLAEAYITSLLHSVTQMSQYIVTVLGISIYNRVALWRNLHLPHGGANIVNPNIALA